MSTKSYRIEFTDDVVSQGPDNDEPCERHEILTFYHTSDTVTWEVNGKERITMSTNELNALIEAAT